MFAIILTRIRIMIQLQHLARIQINKKWIRNRNTEDYRYIHSKVPGTNCNVKVLSPGSKEGQWMLKAASELKWKYENEMNLINRYGVFGT